MKSKFFLYCASVVLLLLLFYLGREFYQKYQIQKQIRFLEDQVSLLDSQNKDVEELLKFLKSPEYKERQARSLLSMQKPGEVAVVLPQNPDLEIPDQVLVEQSNFRKWWNYFFVKK